MGGGHPTLRPFHATLSAFVSLALTSAPALLLGFVLAGLVSGFVRTGQASLLAGRSASSQAMRGVAFGLPLPICSCGVVPCTSRWCSAGCP